MPSAMDGRVARSWLWSLVVLAMACSGSDKGDSGTPSPDTADADSDTDSDSDSDSDSDTDADTDTDTDTAGAPLSLTVTVEDNPSLVHEKRFVVSLSAPADVSLQCTHTVDGAEVHALAGQASDSYELRMYGLLADATYDCEIDAGAGGQTAGWADSVTTSPVPFAAELPVFTITSGTRYGHYTVFNHWRQAGDRNHRVLVMDLDGNLRWYWEAVDAKSPGIESNWHPDLGHMVIGGGRGIDPRRMDLSGDVVHQVPPYSTDITEYYHHDGILTDDLELVGIVQEMNQIGADLLEGFVVLAHDPAGVETFRWHSQDPSSSTLKLPRDEGFDPWHTNAVLWVDDAQGPAVYVSLKGIRSIVRIDRSTGDVTWALGTDGDFDLVDNSGASLGAENWFFGQHAPEVDGNRILVYDNGLDRVPRFSRVVEYEFDTTTMTATLLWDWTRPDWYEPNYGDADRLPNGNVMVATGHCNTCDFSVDSLAFIAEIDPTTGDQLWSMEFTSPVDSVYRAQFVDGCDIFANQKYCP